MHLSVCYVSVIVLLEMDATWREFRMKLAPLLAIGVLASSLCSTMTIISRLMIAFTENVEDRFAAMGWHILFVENGNTDYDAIRQSIADAKAVTDKPTFIKVMLYFQLMFLCRCLASFNRSRSLTILFHCRLPPLLGMVHLIKLIVTVFTVVHSALKRWRLLDRA